MIPRRSPTQIPPSTSKIELTLRKSSSPAARTLRNRAFSNTAIALLRNPNQTRPSEDVNEVAAVPFGPPNCSRLDHVSPSRRRFPALLRDSHRRPALSDVID